MLCNFLDHLELAGGRRGTLGGLTEAFGNIHLNLRDDTGASGQRYHGTSFFVQNLFFLAGKINRQLCHPVPVPFLLRILLIIKVIKVPNDWLSIVLSLLCKGRIRYSTHPQYRTCFKGLLR